MADEGENEGQGPIETPKRNRKADVGRAAARGMLGAIPLAGSAIAEAADQLLPDPTAADRERWEGDVTEGVNSLHGRVGELDQRTGKRTISLSNGAGAVARFMIEKCPDGLASEWATIEELQTAYPEISKNELLDGLGDLELHGWVKTIGFIGSPSRYCLTEYAYEALDPPLMHWNPKEDARVLARHVLEQEGTIGVRRLDEAMGWPRRRFNPALRIVVGFVGEGRVSRSLQPDYVTAHFMLNNVERAQLRQFAAES